MSLNPLDAHVLLKLRDADETLWTDRFTKLTRS